MHCDNKNLKKHVQNSIHVISSDFIFLEVILKSKFVFLPCIKVYAKFTFYFQNPDESRLS